MKYISNENMDLIAPHWFTQAADTLKGLHGALPDEAQCFFVLMSRESSCEVLSRVVYKGGYDVLGISSISLLQIALKQDLRGVPIEAGIRALVTFPWWARVMPCIRILMGRTPK